MARKGLLRVDLEEPKPQFLAKSTHFSAPNITPGRRFSAPDLKFEGLHNLPPSLEFWRSATYSESKLWRLVSMKFRPSET